MNIMSNGRNRHTGSRSAGKALTQGSMAGVIRASSFLMSFSESLTVVSNLGSFSKQNHRCVVLQTKGGHGFEERMGESRGNNQTTDESRPAVE